MRSNVRKTWTRQSSRQVFFLTRADLLRPFLIDYNRFHSVLRADPKEGPLLARCVRLASVTTTVRGYGGDGGILSYRRRGVYHSATPFAPDRD